jgi:hypothetical protein
MPSTGTVPEIECRGKYAILWVILLPLGLKVSRGTKRRRRFMKRRKKGKKG